MEAVFSEQYVSVFVFADHYFFGIKTDRFYFFIPCPGFFDNLQNKHFCNTLAVVCRAYTRVRDDPCIAFHIEIAFADALAVDKSLASFFDFRKLYFDL